MLILHLQVSSHTHPGLQPHSSAQAHYVFLPHPEEPELSVSAALHSPLSLMIGVAD